MTCNLAAAIVFGAVLLGFIGFFLVFARVHRQALKRAGVDPLPPWFGRVTPDAPSGADRHEDETP